MSFTTTLVFYLTFGAGVAAPSICGTSGARPANGSVALSPPLLFLAPLSPAAAWSAPQITAAEKTGTRRRRSTHRIRWRRRSARWSPSSTRLWAASTAGPKACLSTSDRGWTNCGSAWRSQAARVRELDRFLARAGRYRRGDIRRALEWRNGPRRASAAIRASRAGWKIIRRLHQLRRRMFDDLLATLAWVRELVTMIHLAKFSGAPASRAEELVAQIAAAVEGLREVSNWGDAEAIKPAMSTRRNARCADTDSARLRACCRCDGFVMPACDGSGVAGRAVRKWGGSWRGRRRRRCYPSLRRPPD